MGGTEFSFCFFSQSSQLTIANPVLGHPPQIAHSFEKKKQQKNKSKRKVFISWSNTQTRVFLSTATLNAKAFIWAKSTAIVSANVYF